MNITKKMMAILPEALREHYLTGGSWEDITKYAAQAILCDMQLRFNSLYGGTDETPGFVSFKDYAIDLGIILENDRNNDNDG